MENLGKTRFPPNPSPHTHKYLNLKDFIKSQNEIRSAREPEVEEPLLGLSSQLIQSEILFQIEFDVAPEPKALLLADLVLEKKYQKKNLE